MFKENMLIGTSHPSPPSGGGIPPSLFDLYVQYKQDTRAIIAWLMSHGTRKYTSLKTVSIRDLIGLAEVVQRKAVMMPDTIDFHFREAIAAREQSFRVILHQSWPEAPGSKMCLGSVTLPKFVYAPDIGFHRRC